MAGVLKTKYYSFAILLRHLFFLTVQFPHNFQLGKRQLRQSTGKITFEATFFSVFITHYGNFKIQRTIHDTYCMNC